MVLFVPFVSSVDKKYMVLFVTFVSFVDNMCPAIHVRPLRGLSTLHAFTPRSLTVVVACFAAPPRPFDDLGSFMV